MLSWAIKAGLPLISCTTTDTVNVAAVLSHLTGMPAVAVAGPEFKKKTLHYLLDSKQKALTTNTPARLYDDLAALGSILVIVNPGTDYPGVFDAGPMPVPKELIAKFLSASLPVKTANAVLPALGGLTLKEVGEVIRLTQVSAHGITPSAVMKTRRATFRGSRGLSIVDTEMDLYIPQPALKHFAEMNCGLFLGDFDYRLRPRGLVLHGTPGTGKSQGAKFLANEWGVPLYRMDATVQYKYVGTSEANMAAILAQVDLEEPCVFMLDEIEKMFGSGSHGTDVIEKMLGQLLWWLQEHTSRVFTVMTSNNLKRLPPELYRPGRVDRIMEFKGLDKDEALGFAMALLKTFELKQPPMQSVKSAVKNLFIPKGVLNTPVNEVAHADVRQSVLDTIKASMSNDGANK